MSAQHEEGRLAGVGGLEIYWQAWLPEGEPRAVVAIAHGVSEHSGRYAWTGEQLTARGYATYALDHRGHGRSPGARAFVDRMANAVADLDALIERASAAHEGKPVFLLGHSFGGAVSLAYALRHQQKLAGLVLSAPLAALEAAPLVTRIAGHVLSVVAPKLGVFDVDPTAVSRDPEVVRDYEQDPLNHHGKLPARTVAEIANTVGGFHDAMPRLELPILLMHGSEDRLTPPAGSEMVYERVSSADKDIKRYPGLYHELLNEPEREDVIEEIARWLDQRAPERQTR